MGLIWLNNYLKDQPVQKLDRSGKKEIKRLEKQLKLHKSDENSKAEAGCLEDIGFIFFNARMYREAVDYWKEALRVYQETNDRPSMAESFSNIGTAFRLMGELSQAARFYNKALVLDHEFNSSEGELKSLHNIGSTWLDLGENENALEIFNNAMELARTEKNGNWEALSLYRLGLVYHALNQYREAFRFYEEGLKISEKHHFLEMMTRCTCGLGQCYDILGEYSQAIPCYEDAIRGAQNLRDADLEMSIKISQAQMNIHLGLLDQGREIANQTADMLTESMTIQTQLALLRAKIYMIYNMRGKAVDLLDTAEKIAEKLPNGYYLCMVWFRKIDLEIESGQYGNALSILQRIQSRYPEGRSLMIDLKSALLLGQIHRGMNQDELALKARESAILKAQCLSSPRYLWRSHHSLGRYCHHQRRFESARDHYSTALKWIDRAASNLDPSLRSVFLHQKDRLQVYQDFIILQISTGHKEAAARILKRLNSDVLNRKIAHLFK
ncbi:tetratricopeptide repeat protein [bacterium]|nr:tetratricopeptide repeat protein [candidate division CSSED10-310 bacterium]